MAAPLAVCSASPRIGFIAFPTSSSLILCHRFGLGVYVHSDFQLGELVGCVNWLAVVWTWRNPERLMNVRQHMN